MKLEFKREYTPWSFFWPITLAVMFGVLLADGAKLVIAVAGLAAVFSQAEEFHGTTPGHLPARPDR